MPASFCYGEFSVPHSETRVPQNKTGLVDIFFEQTMI